VIVVVIESDRGPTQQSVEELPSGLLALDSPQDGIGWVSDPGLTPTNLAVQLAPKSWQASSVRLSLLRDLPCLRLSSEVADRNVKLLAISFSREILKRLVESIPETKMFSFGNSGTSFSVWRRLIVCYNCWRVVAPPHIVILKLPNEMSNMSGIFPADHILGTHR